MEGEREAREHMMQFNPQNNIEEIKWLMKMKMMMMMMMMMMK
jgi:hypothetical protein